MAIPLFLPRWLAEQLFPKSDSAVNLQSPRYGFQRSASIGVPSNTCSFCHGHFTAIMRAPPHSRLSTFNSEITDGAHTRRKHDASYTETTLSDQQ